MKKFVFKAANILCSLAILAAPLAERACRTIFYEPEQPEGLADFVRSKKVK